jgi:hypothetical protein
VGDGGISTLKTCTAVMFGKEDKDDASDEQLFISINEITGAPAVKKVGAVMIVVGVCAAALVGYLLLLLSRGSPHAAFLSTL